MNMCEEDGVSKKRVRDESGSKLQSYEKFERREGRERGRNVKDFSSLQTRLVVK